MLLLLRRGYSKRPGSAIPNRGLSVLVTGRVNSRNWCRSHLLPLAEAGCVEKILFLMDGPAIQHPKIHQFRPPEFFSRGVLRLAARSVYLFYITWKEQPSVIVGFSLFPSAVLSLLASPLAGAAVVYQMTGGAVELANGGIAAEFPAADIPKVCGRLLSILARKICGHFDTIIVRGRRTKEFVARHTRARRIHIIAGSVDPCRFVRNGQADYLYDIAFVGRLVPVKQPSHLVTVISKVARRRPNTRAVIVGDGPLMRQAMEEAVMFGLGDRVRFIGHSDKVENIVTQSKVFLMTSRSEGLSIALAEAMLAGAVPVVPDVGDLSDLVKDGETGWLIPPGDFEAYARRICQTLEDDTLRRQLSANARAAAFGENALNNVIARWKECLESITGLETQRSADAQGSLVRADEPGNPDMLPEPANSQASRC